MQVVVYQYVVVFFEDCCYYVDFLVECFIELLYGVKEIDGVVNQYDLFFGILCCWQCCQLFEGDSCFYVNVYFVWCLWVMIDYG